MKVFLWYKWKILKSSSFKLKMCLLIPIVVFLVQKILGVETEIILSFWGMSVTLLFTYALFTVGDLLRIPCFIALGKRVSDLWNANIVFLLVMGYVITFIAEAIVILLLRVDAAQAMQCYLNAICTIPFSAALIGLSTIHFRNYSKKEVNLASVFAILNAVCFLFPIIAKYVGMVIEGGFYIALLIAGVIILAILNLYLKMQNAEKLVFNLKKEVSLYDKSILMLGEE